MTLRRGISRRGVLAGAAAGAALLPLPAIAEPRTVKFTLAWLAQGSFAYVYVARAKGIMKARGIDFDIARGFGSMASAQAIAGGQFEFGIVAAPPLILSVAKGLPLIALATCDYDSTMGVGVLDDSPIPKPQDLAGKKIASVPTSGEFPFFPAYAEKVGLAANSIEFVHVDNKVLERVLMEKAGRRDHLLRPGQRVGDVVERRAEPLDAVQRRRHPQRRPDDRDPEKDAGKRSALCEAVTSGLLEALAFIIDRPAGIAGAVPEGGAGDGAQPQRQGIRPHRARHVAARRRSPGGARTWAGMVQSGRYAETTDLVMQYLNSPGMQRPQPDAFSPTALPARSS